MELNKKNMQQLMILISFGIGLFWILSNLELVLGFLSHFIHLLLPFIIGAIIAFILNIITNQLEKSLLKNVRNKRMISFILTLILFVSFLLLICFIIGPELIHSLKEIVKLAPNAYDQLLIFLKENRNIMNGSFKNIIDSIISLDLDLSALYKTIINNWQSLFHSGFSILSNTLSSLYTFFIGLVFSIF